MNSRLSFLKLFAASLMASLLLLAACQKKAEAPAVASPSVVVDSALSDDSVMVYFDVRGEGDHSLMFVHCWSCDRSYWRHEVDEFGNDYKVVTLDLGGHGQSGLGRENWTMAAYGADVAAVVDKLSLENVILVGHSMGGAVCLEAARRLPGKVTAIVGVDNFQNFHQKFTEEQIGGWVGAFKADFVSTTDAYVRSLFSPDTDSALVNLVATHLDSAPPDVAVSSITEAVLYDYADALAQVRVPIRTISSDKFPTDSAGNAALAASFSVKIMPGMGHFLQLEDPVTFNRLLHETVEEFWPRSE